MYPRMTSPHGRSTSPSLSLSLYIYIYTYIYIYICTRMYTLYIHIYTHACMYAYILRHIYYSQSQLVHTQTKQLNTCINNLRLCAPCTPRCRCACTCGTCPIDSSRSFSERTGDMACRVFTYGGFYVRAMNLSSEFVFAKHYDFRATFGTGRGGRQVTPTIVPFGISMLAVVINKGETAVS